MMVDKMKKVIKFAIDQDIDYLETFLGYEGDEVLKITTKSRHAVENIGSFLKQIGLDYKEEFDVSGGRSAGYKLFVGVEDLSIFKLKREKI